MSNKKDGRSSRRALIAAAAASAAALPLIAVSAKAQARGTRIVVDLGGVDLPRAIADNLENDIRRACLMAVARAMPRTRFKNVPLGPGTRGIIIRPADLPGGGMEQH